MTGHLAHLPLLMAASFFSFAVFAGDRVGPVLQSLEGGTTVSVVAADGTRRDAKLDESLQAGDVVETGPGTVLTIAFEQGSQVLVANGSKVKVTEESEIASEPKVPAVDVQEGGVRALVETYSGGPAGAPSAAPGGAKSHRFVIRTKSAVLGVRGTDFVVQVKDDSLALNTFSGTVEVAADLASFGSPGMISVTEGRALTNDGTQPFVPAEFLKEFYKKHPKLEKLYDKAKKEAGDGTLQAKFALLRARYEELKLKKGDGPDTIEFTGKKPSKPNNSNAPKTKDKK